MNDTAQPSLDYLYHACRSTPEEGIYNRFIKPVPEEDEDRSLGSDETESLKQSAHVNVVKIISVMLLGIFVAQTDTSILMATHAIIASEFNALKDSSWLIISFSLAGAATQTLVRNIIE